MKTENAIRRIRLHSDLIRLGFLQFVEAMRAEGEKLLFPEKYPAGGTKRAIGDVFCKIWWIYLRPTVPFLRRGQAMHSVRHTVADALKDDFNLERRNDFFGWSQKDLGEGASRYGSRTVLEKVHKMVETIPVVTKF